VAGEMTRLAFAFGHLGDSFHGSQIQPGLRTAQGELQRVLVELGFIDKPTGSPQPCVLASRTDAGVHVRMNVAAINISSEYWDGMNERGFINAVNDQLDGDIVVWAADKASENWSPRRAESRSYRYRLEGLDDWREVEEDVFQKWLDIFVGKHDFRNFCRTDNVPDTVREVLELKAWKSESDGRIIGFEIRGRAFLWNMVRRIAAALTGLAKGTMDIEEVRNALNNPLETKDLGLVPADWLILWEVEHQDIDLVQKSRISQSISILSNPPEKAMNHRRFQLWTEAAKLEQKQICYAQWDSIMNR